MKKEWLVKTFAWGIIVLFIFMSFTPNISGNISESRNKGIINIYKSSPLQVTITRPVNGIYLNDHKIFPFFVPLALCGDITIVAEIEPLGEIERIEYYINDVLQETQTGPPWFSSFILSWQPPFSKIKFGIEAFDFYGNQAGDNITIWRLFR